MGAFGCGCGGYRVEGDAVSTRSFKFSDGEIWECWLGGKYRLSRWLDAPGVFRDGTLSDAQRDQLSEAIAQFDQSEQTRVA